MVGFFFPGADESSFDGADGEHRRVYFSEQRGERLRERGYMVVEWWTGGVGVTADLV